MSAPVRTTCRCDGTISARLQVAGDIDLIPVGAAATWEDDGPTTMIGVKLQPWLVLTEAENMGLNPDRVSIPAQLQLRDPLIEHLFRALGAELESDGPLGHVYPESLAAALASHLLRRYAQPVSGRLRGLRSNRRVRRVIEYVHDNLSATLSLFELASVAGLGPTQFKVLFKQCVGIPVHQYIMRQRVDCAVRLITESDLSLSEISIQAGFSSPSHMAKLTRQITGLSPAELRDRT